ncbi:MAG: DUF1553 domain-containing protein [Gemmataceae bacterium]|nr:DUF1553 domain-containing protein [Gemmataceae bacterium]
MKHKFTKLPSLLTLGLPCLLSLLAVAGNVQAQPLTVLSPQQKISLPDPFANWQILVSQAGNDVTNKAAYSSANEKVARVASSGHVVPTGDGETTIHITLAGETAKAPVLVSGFSHGRSIDFKTEIVPLLSKLGCNAGGCHGKASGQNGFKLSLFGFDTDFDYESIVLEARGRRVSPSSPEASLFLLKPSGQAPHGGGKKLHPGTADYQLVSRWLAAGAPPVAKSSLALQRLRVLPADFSFKLGSVQQIAVIAEYSDGSLRDVTRQSEFSSNIETIGTVDPQGLVQGGSQSGEAVIMARHMGFVGASRAIVPHGKPTTQFTGFQPAGKIDELAMNKWKKLGLEPSAPCDDGAFIRRLFVDLCGRLPRPEETRVFLDDTRPDKRPRLIDKLLDGPDYPANFAMRWGVILRNSSHAGADRAAYAFHNWIKDMIARNRPYDEFVRGIVAASGEWQDAPAVNWYWQSRDDQVHQVTADTAQVFLGVRLQCARCHHHPYERWGQADYYGLAGFFTRLGRKSFGEPPPYFASPTPTTGEKNPLTGKTPEPKYLDGPEVKFPAEEDPRHALVDWMAKPENPYFAKTFVNRMWGHFLGRGLFQEVDDLRETNPPSNPELLDFLAQEFIRQKFNMKSVIRMIVNSRVYQLGSQPSPHNKNDQQNFARYYARRLPAEVLFDSVNQLSGSKSGLTGINANGRAIDLPHENFGSYFLDTFDRPRRVTACECERSSSATLAQVLLLANSDEIEGKISGGDGRLAGLIKAKKSAEEIVGELYLAAFSRRPTTDEKTKITAFINKVENKQQAFEDVLWAILNSREFLFNH